jgi:2-keto-3-deoxy-L-rhamnonate aldolase RhmA
VPSGDRRPLRARVRAGTPVIATFVKTASHQTLEILGLSGLDAAIIDAEHAPFDRATLDRMIAAAPSALPVMVRVPSHDPAFINGCLDMGATGLLVPHTCDAAGARAIAQSVKYGLGKRGFSPSGRAGGYGTVDGARYRAQADALSTIWCQIEDAEALDALDEIAAVEEIDCLFIGPADLSLSLGAAGPADPRVQAAIRAVAEAGRRHHRSVGMFIGQTAQIPALLALGITVFVCGSDQGLLLGRARELAGELARTARETVD